MFEIKTMKKNSDSESPEHVMKKKLLQQRYKYMY